jgi:hypothetical protein
MRIEVMDHQLADVLRQKTPAERLAIAWGMWESANYMLTNLVRSEHAEWTDEQIKREVVQRLAHETGRVARTSRKDLE